MQCNAMHVSRCIYTIWLIYICMYIYICFFFLGICPDEASQPFCRLHLRIFALTGCALIVSFQEPLAAWTGITHLRYSRIYSHTYKWDNIFPYIFLEQRRYCWNIYIHSLYGNIFGRINMLLGDLDSFNKTGGFSP